MIAQNCRFRFKLEFKADRVQQKMVQRTIVVNHGADLIEFNVEPRWCNRPLAACKQQFNCPRYTHSTVTHRNTHVLFFTESVAPSHCDSILIFLNIINLHAIFYLHHWIYSVLATTGICWHAPLLLLHNSSDQQSTYCFQFAYDCVHIRNICTQYMYATCGNYVYTYIPVLHMYMLFTCTQHRYARVLKHCIIQQCNTQQQRKHTLSFLLTLQQ